MTRAGVTATLATLRWRYAIGALSGILLFAGYAAAQTPQPVAAQPLPVQSPQPAAAVRAPQPPAARAPQLTLAPTPQPAVAPVGQPLASQGPYAGYPLQDWHRKLFSESEFPSAVVCSQCHRRIFEEWTSSNHAYASISPMFHKFDQRIQELASGTVGTFCVRCHQQVGTERGEPRAAPLWERSPVASEGVTCVTCHRVSQEWTKVNGERNIDPAPITAPITGPGVGTHLQDVANNPQEYRVSGVPGLPGSQMHSGVLKFDQIEKSEFCVSCHQVAVHPGIALEVVWNQYRDSPAMRQGVNCQACHMGKVPGVNAGYETAPIAVVNGRIVGGENQRHTNHAFFGPGYPIAHPGLFPFNPRAKKYSIQDWIAFDYRAEWGEPAWEDKLARRQVAATFPPIWQSRAAREEARLIVRENERALEVKRRLRVAVMENGGHLDGPFFGGAPRVGQALDVKYKITNTNIGHNLPSGSLGAQPEIWVNVAVIDPDGKRVWETGYVDANGDMADLHSLEVAKGHIKPDHQLINLQTKFLTTNVKGTDREMYLPVNLDVDQIPFIRPPGVPSPLINHPPFIRMEGRSIPPLVTRDADYTIPAEAFTKPGTYTIQARLRSRAEPIYFMKFVFATRDMEQRINDWMIDIHPTAATFEVR